MLNDIKHVYGSSELEQFTQVSWNGAPTLIQMSN